MKKRVILVSVGVVLTLAIFAGSAVALYNFLHPYQKELTPQALSAALVKEPTVCVTVPREKTVDNPIPTRDTEQDSAAVLSALSTDAWSHAWFGAEGEGEAVQITVWSDEWITVYENDVVYATYMADSAWYRAPAGTFEAVKALAAA